MGRDVFTTTINEGKNTIVSVKLSNGVYQIKVQYGDKTFIQKLVIE